MQTRGELRRVTDISTGADAPLWSPDGQMLAFVSEVYPECNDDACNRQRETEKAASKVQAKCLEKNMLVLTTSIYDTLRLIPPLNITKEDMAKGIQILKEAVEEVAAGK